MTGTDWCELERLGLIEPSPGREEAAKAAQEISRAKKAVIAAKQDAARLKKEKHAKGRK